MPAIAQAIASGQRRRSRPKTRASSAPKSPTPPQAAICQGVNGPWPKNTLDASAPIAPTTKPGAPPST